MTDRSSALYLTDSEVAALVTINDVVEALEEMLPQETTGNAANVPKALGTWEPRSSAHSLGALSTAEGLALFKTWVNTPNGATAMVTMFDSEDGALLAVMEGTTIGALRTAAISGLATRWMAASDAAEVALVGSGRQALAHIAALAATRPLARVRVFSPTPARRDAFAARADRAFSFDVVACDSLQACVAGAPIVSLLTRAAEPFLSLESLARGVHVNAVGAVLPANAEMTSDVLPAADLVVVDNVTNVRLTSREFRTCFGSDQAGWDTVDTLGEIITAGARRPRDLRLSVFKSAGMGLSDLAVAALAWRAARAQGVGRDVARPVMAAPRWRELSAQADVADGS